MLIPKARAPWGLVDLPLNYFWDERDEISAGWTHTARGSQTALRGNSPVQMGAEIQG